MSKERELTFALPVKDDAKALLDYSKKVGSETDFLSFGPEGLKYSVAQEELFIESLYENENNICYWQKTVTRLLRSVRLRGACILNSHTVVN